MGELLVCFLSFVFFLCLVSMAICLYHIDGKITTTNKFLDAIYRKMK